MVSTKSSYFTTLSVNYGSHETINNTMTMHNNSPKFHSESHYLNPLIALIYSTKQIDLAFGNLLKKIEDKSFRRKFTFSYIPIIGDVSLGIPQKDSGTQGKLSHHVITKIEVTS